MLQTVPADSTGTTVAPGTTAAGAATTAAGGGRDDRGSSGADHRRGGAPSRIAVVGDSVGITLVRNAPASVKQALTIANGAPSRAAAWSRATCARTAKFRWGFSGCKGWPEKWASNATKAQAQVALVTIGAWDVFDLTQDGKGRGLRFPRDGRPLQRPAAEGHRRVEGRQA